MRTKVRTTPAEVDKFRKIRVTLKIYQDASDAAYNAVKAAYKAENRPMTCNPANDSPEKVEAFFAPKSEAIRAAENAYDVAFATWRKVCQMLGGAKVWNRLHHLEQAGVLDA